MIYRKININRFKGKKLFYQTSNSKLYIYNNLYIIKETLKNKEKNILNNIKHKNIIKLLDNYEDNIYNYDVMKYYDNGDMYSFIKDNKLNLNEKIELFKKMIEPIYYLHKNNIVHLDLKLENYVLNKNNEPILIDFDHSKYHNSNYYNLLETNLKIGTKSYMAPEMSNYYFNKSTDIYSLGIIFYLLLTNNFYNNKIEYNFLRNIPKKNIKMLEEMLNIDSKNRPSIFDIKYFYLN